MLELESSISRKYQNFFSRRLISFFVLGPKSPPGSPTIYYLDSYMKSYHKKADKSSIAKSILVKQTKN